MLRADWEWRLRCLSPSSAADRRVVSALPRVDIVLLSDYAKGVLRRAGLATSIDEGEEARQRVIVDPKNANLAIYRGRDIAHGPNQEGIHRADAPPPSLR